MTTVMTSLLAAAYGDAAATVQVIEGVDDPTRLIFVVGPRAAKSSGSLYLGVRKAVDSLAKGRLAANPPEVFPTI